MRLFLILLLNKISTKKTQMKKIFTLLYILSFSFHAFSQKTIVKGNVTNKADGLAIIGAHVMLNKDIGTTTDSDGNYSIEIPVGINSITFKFIGFTTENKVIIAKENEPYILNVEMSEESRKLDAVVVSAGKFEQKISDVTVSMEIIKPSMIESENNVSIEEAITKVPGVVVLERQASIRGGSGYSFGAGSRVLMLVDDLPMLTGASGESRWDFAPVENIEQIEVIKGASSALYGSSALNGAINVRTKFPTSTKGETKITSYYGIYGQPEREAIRWYTDYNPIFSGTRFSHGQVLGNLDLIVSGNISSDNSWRQNDEEQRYRFSVNTRYRSKKHEGLSYSLNTNYMKRKGNLYLLWLDGDSGVYKTSSDFDHTYHNQNLSISPSVTYFYNGRTKHSLKARVYSIRNRNNTGQKNYDDMFYEEYQFQKFFDKELTWTSGLTSSQVLSDSEIYGSEYHNSISMGAYSQVDKKFNRLKFSLGARWEAHKIDDENFSSHPVFRSGLNYQLYDNGFLRASFGQGFRYPTIAERYTQTGAGSVNIFPNADVKPEKGWSSEIAYKQGFRFGGWNGYIDLATFWTEYTDMIEFMFGYHSDSINLYPESEYFLERIIGFKAYNVSNARIYGIDFTATAEGKILSIPVKLLAGYTYTNPIDMDFVDSLGLNADEAVLKYRFYHNAKIDIEFSPKKFVIGMSMDYHSKIVNIDAAFEDTLCLPNSDFPLYLIGGPVGIFPGMKEYRETYDKGKLVFNFRLGYEFNDRIKANVILKNAFNREYMGRPGDVRAPRNITFQLAIKV